MKLNNKDKRSLRREVAKLPYIDSGVAQTREVTVKDYKKINPGWEKQFEGTKMMPILNGPDHTLITLQSPRNKPPNHLKKMCKIFRASSNKQEASDKLAVYIAKVHKFAMEMKVTSQQVNFK